MRNGFVRIMVLNCGKCHYVLIGNHDEPDKINVNGTEITSCNNEKFLSVGADKKL